MTVALSCTVEPSGALVMIACAALWTSVAVDEFTFVIVSGSQAPVDELYVPFPEYVAWKLRLPETVGVNVNAVASALPPESATGSDVAAAAPSHGPFRNHLNVTVPVGVGRPGWPVTVALSCTVVPAGTLVTTS